MTLCTWPHSLARLAAPSSNLPLHFLLVRALQNNLRIVSHSHSRKHLIHFSCCHQALLDFEPCCWRIVSPSVIRSSGTDSTSFFLRNKTSSTFPKAKGHKMVPPVLLIREPAPTPTQKSPRKNPIPRNFTTLKMIQNKKSHTQSFDGIHVLRRNVVCFRKVDRDGTSYARNPGAGTAQHTVHLTRHDRGKNPF